jgi:hypothetical protein
MKKAPRGAFFILVAGALSHSHLNLLILSDLPFGYERTYPQSYPQLHRAAIESSRIRKIDSLAGSSMGGQPVKSVKKQRD